MNYYVLIIEDVTILFSHTKNKSCEGIKEMIRRVSDCDVLSKVVDKMVEEGFRLVSNVEVINVNKEMNKEE